MKNLKLLGKGKFGKVFEVENKKGFKFALKVIDPGDLSFMEVDILSRLKSPYLIRTLGDGVMNSNIGKGIPLELKENNLCNLVGEDLSGGKVKRLIMGLILGMRCMHQKGFLHLDIKPRNCLYDIKDGIYTPYLSDFGLSIRCNNAYIGIKKRKRVGTFKYSPYELLENSEYYIYTDKSDVWSMGITILSFLGLQFKMDFENNMSHQDKLQKIKKFWDNSDIEKIINETLNKPFLSEKDKIDLYEMLTHMLKKDPKERISSKDFEKLRFFNNNSIEDSCHISEPKEILYIPYSSTNVVRGIEKLRSYFKNTEKNFNIEVYFLAIEIFIRIMSINPLELSEKTLEKDIQMAFFTSVKYYNLVNLREEDMKIFKDNSYDITEMLNGDIAPNRYYYKTNSIEDLILVDRVILQNYNLICFYNYLNVEELYKFFRQNYSYKETKKSEIPTCKEFFNLMTPEKNTESMIENERKIFSYKDIRKEQKVNSEDVPEIDKIQGIEARFRELFLLELKKGLENYTEKDREDIKRIKDSEDIVFFYNKFFTNNNINIYDLMINFDHDIDFSVIEEDIYGKLHFKGNLDSFHILFKCEGTLSLIVRNDSKPEMIHYYSNFNENLKKYFSSKNLDYKNNYELKTPSVCKINEICFLFLIYYNTVEKLNSYNVIYLQDKTLKTVLTYCVIKRKTNFI